MSDRRKTGLRWGRVMWCVAAWLCCVIFGVGITAYLLNAEVMAWDHVGYATGATLLMASGLSAWLMSMKAVLGLKQLALLSAGNLSAYLLMCVMLFSGVETGVFPLMLVILAGGAVPLLLQNARNKKPKYRVRKRPTG